MIAKSAKEAKIQSNTAAASVVEEEGEASGLSKQGYLFWDAYWMFLPNNQNIPYIYQQRLNLLKFLKLRQLLSNSNLILLLIAKDTEATKGVEIIGRGR